MEVTIWNVYYCTFAVETFLRYNESIVARFYGFTRGLISLHVQFFPTVFTKILNKLQNWSTVENNCTRREIKPRAESALPRLLGKNVSTTNVRCWTIQMAIGTKLSVTDYTTTGSQNHGYYKHWLSVFATLYLKNQN